MTCATRGMYVDRCLCKWVVAGGGRLRVSSDPLTSVVLRPLVSEQHATRRRVSFDNAPVDPCSDNVLIRIPTQHAACQVARNGLTVPQVAGAIQHVAHVLRGVTALASDVAAAGDDTAEQQQQERGVYARQRSRGDPRKLCQHVLGRCGGRGCRPQQHGTGRTQVLGAAGLGPWSNSGHPTCSLWIRSHSAPLRAFALVSICGRLRVPMTAASF